MHNIVLEPVGRILNTNVLVVFVYHTHQSRDPRFPQEAILPETVFRLAKLFPTSHAASGWFPRLRKSQPWVSTPHHPSLHPPPPHPACLPQRVPCQKDKPRCISRNILRNQSGKLYLIRILHMSGGIIASDWTLAEKIFFKFLEQFSRAFGMIQLQQA